MATILLVEDVPDLSFREASLLEEAGHRVIRCGGGPGPSPYSACPLIRTGSCSLADSADLILFSSGLFAMRGRNYSGMRILEAYRAHPRYGRLPMVVVSVVAPPIVGGTGPLRFVEKFSPPRVIVTAVEEMVARRKVAAR